MEAVVVHRREEALHPEAAKRANAYFALARALEPPGTWSEELPDLLAALCPFPGRLPEIGGRLAGLADDAMAARDPLSLDHARLFLGPFEIRAAPWASFYLEPEPRLMGPVSEYVAQAYAEAGLGPGTGPRDVPDHVTHELEFMYFLAFGEATTGVCVWYARQERFWREHLGRWLLRFAEAVSDSAAHPFYSALAEALTEFHAREVEVFGGPAADV